MTIKKLKYTKDGESKTRGKLYGIFADHCSIIRKLPLFSDRKASEEAARKVEKLVSLRAANEMLPPELTRWIETTTPFIREKLAEYGIIAAARLSASKCLSDHIAEWKASLIAKGVTLRQAELVASRTTKVFGACRFTFWSDISAAKIQTHLHELRKNGEGISAQTYNHYLRAVKQFCRWCVREGRAANQP